MAKAWSQVNIASIDLETTGLDSQRRICEFAVVPIKNGLVCQGNAYVSVVNPWQAIHWAATKINGLKISDVKGKPTFREKYVELPKVFAREVYIVQNAKFDVDTLKNEAPDFKFPIILDTKIWATKIHGSKMCSLEKLIAHYGLHRRIQIHPYGRELEQHRAYYDAVATALLFTDFVIRHLGQHATLGEIANICEYKPK